MNKEVNNIGSTNNLLGFVTGPRQRILTSEIFLAIGQDVGADTLELVVRIPGDKDPKLLRIYRESSGRIRKPEVILFASLNGSIIEEVLNTGSEIVTESLIAIPLFFQGTVIGCACVQTHSQQGFSKQAISKLRDFAPIAALVAHGERELAAAERFSSSLIRWRVGENVMHNSVAIQGIAELLLNVLSPAAVIIHLSVGFKNYIQIAGESDEAKMIREKLDENLPDKGLPSVIKRLAESMEIVEANLLDVSVEANLLDVSVEANLLDVSVEADLLDVSDDDKDDDKDENILVGKLYAVVSKNKYAVLTRGSSYSLSHTFATLTTDAVLNAVRDGFHSLTKELVLALNSEELVRYSQWFANVEDIAQRARLLWVVATHIDDDGQYGRPEWQKVVQACLEKREPRSDRIDLFRIDDPTMGKHTVLSIYLPGTKSWIWCGVEAESFGAELSTLSPWRVFLDRFSQVADSALLRLRVQRFQIEAAETRNLATSAVTSHILFHQVANMVLDIVSPISAIKGALAVGRLKMIGDTPDVAEEAVELIKLGDQSATKLHELASMFLNVSKLDTRRPCSILGAVNESKNLFEFSLKSYQIQLHVNIAQDLSIDVPYSVAYMAITNLLSNAKDAIGKHGGNIWIEAEVAGGMIHCYVMNDGPPIDPEIQDHIFEIGATTKQNQDARGWGLYLVRKSLSEHGGYIKLSSSSPGETKFTIQFPPVR